MECSLAHRPVKTQQFIKRPLNAYMIWTRQERQKIVANDPKIKMNEVSKAIQMGERWKAMSDKEKRPYFEMAKKYAIEHKKALKDNPNLTYIPPKKKAAKEHGHDPNGPKSPLSVHSPSPSTPVTPGHGAMQVAQALGVRTPNTVGPGGVTAFRVPATPTTQTRFQPITSVNGQQMVGTTTIRTVDDRTPIGTRVIAAPPPPRLTAAQALEFYYQSLCQPAFPLLVESPSNPLGMSMTPHQYYEQWQQALVPQAQPQPPSATGAHH
jgi:hypothetical protein